MNKKTGIILGLAAIFLLSCGPSHEEKARVRMNLAKVLLQQKDTLNALLQLDSISLLYPKAIYAVSAAKNLKSEINWEILRRKQAELDSIGRFIVVLEAGFDKVKTPYDRYLHYIHKRQGAELMRYGPFIRVYLDERGEISLSSNYNGPHWLGHTGLKVYCDQGEAVTGMVRPEDPDYHRSDFSESRWEKATYRKGTDNGVIRFIAEHSGESLKAALTGNGNHVFTIEARDKEAVKETFQLSEAIRRRNYLENEIRILNNSLNIR